VIPKTTLAALHFQTKNAYITNASSEYFKQQTKYGTVIQSHILSNLSLTQQIPDTCQMSEHLLKFQQYQISLSGPYPSLNAFHISI